MFIILVLWVERDEKGKGSRSECSYLAFQVIAFECGLFDATVYIVGQLKSLFETSSLSRCLKVYNMLKIDRLK